jgi:nitroreductase
MRTTFACRAFTDDAVPDADLVTILDRARFASSGGNRQGWRVIVVRERATKDALVELSLPALRLYVAQVAAGEAPWNTIIPSKVDPATVSADDGGALDWFRVIARAPVMLVVGVDLRAVASADSKLDRVGVVSGASVYPFVQNILLTARSLGYGSALTTFLAAAEPAAQELLGMPSHVAIAALVPVGRPARVLTKLRRNPVAAFTFQERWDGPPLG